LWDRVAQACMYIWIAWTRADRDKQ
jgi:hypothetical protein